MKIKTKRIYEEPATDDGYRILTDRLWPRGMTKEKAHLDEWNKDIAPSSGLRKWFGHKAERFDEFSKHYLEELGQHSEELERLVKISEKKNLTLLYAAKEEKINHTAVLKNKIEEMKKSL